MGPGRAMGRHHTTHPKPQDWQCAVPSWVEIWGLHILPGEQSRPGECGLLLCSSGTSWGTDRMVTVEGARGEEVGGREWEGAGRRPQDAEGTRAGGPGEPPARGSPRGGTERAAAGRWARGRGGTARRRGATQEPAGCRWVPPPGSALPARGGGRPLPVVVVAVVSPPSSSHGAGPLPAGCQGRVCLLVLPRRRCLGGLRRRRRRRRAGRGRGLGLGRRRLLGLSYCR